MAKQTISTTAPATSAPAGANIINSNFTELYSMVLPGAFAFSGLPSAASYPLHYTMTTDKGPYFSNGVNWIAITTGQTVVAGIYTYSGLPSAFLYTNSIALTSDSGPVFSNGTVWLPLYNPTNSTLGISINSPLPPAQTSSAYTATYTATQAVGAVVWSLVSKYGSANSWVINSSTGVLSATPGTAGTDTITVQAIDSSGASAQKTVALTVQASLTPAATPTFSPAAGSYSSTQTVTIATTTGSPTIYYTTNGSTPTTSSTVYSAPITVSASQTVKAIATSASNTQSLVGSAAYVISAAGSSFKFNPGNYLMVPQYGFANSASLANDFGWIKRFQAKPVTGFVMQRHWSDLDQGSTIDNTSAHAVAGTGNYANFTAEVGACFNLHQTYNPGSQFGLYVNTIEIWKSAFPSGSFSCSVPNYILNCGGSLSVPNTFGSGSSTAYTMYQFSNGKCGFGFYAYNSPTAGLYGFLEAAWWDPGVVAAFNNFMAALALYQLPTATAYAGGTTYGLGALVSSGGNIYCSIQTANVGNSVTNTTWWVPSNNTYAGQTLDLCPRVEFIGNNDETSATFSTGTHVPGSTTTANACTYQNYYIGLLGHMASRQASFPHTMCGGCYSFVITGSNGTIQDNSTWTGYMSTINATPGLTFSQADMSVTQFTPGSAHPTGAMMGYIGINPDGSFGGTLPAFGSFSTSYVGVMPAVLQVQPLDYSGNNATTTNVNQLIASMVTLKASHRLMSCQDNQFNTTVWGTVIQPTLIAGTAVTSTRPTNLP